MCSCTPLNATMGWKLYSYLEKHPQNYDVTFSVGPEKTIVKALKIILRSSSSVLEREFEDGWKHAVVKEEEGIPLPDLDPEAFKLFLKLMILDTWSVDALKALKLPSNQLLHLMVICRKYGMTVAVENLKELIKQFLRNFDTYVNTEDFLLLSQQQLESILSSDDVAMSEQDLCKYACKWADEQCKKQKLQMTSVNRRQVLGDCLYQIRFPLMSYSEFGSVTRNYPGLLSMEEALEIFQFISMEANERKTCDTKELKFKFEKRRLYTSVPAGCSVVSVVKLFPIINAPFVCDGSVKKNFFNTDTKIKLRGCGFVGPIDADSFYNVTVHIWKRTNASSNEVPYSDKIEKRIFAQKSKAFYFIFDQPVVLDKTHGGWSNTYVFQFTLKGPNTRSLDYNNYGNKFYNGSSEFTICWNSPQLVEILYNFF